MDYWWIVFLYILSIMMIVKPEILWKIEHFLSVKNGEPSDGVPCFYESRRHFSSNNNYFLYDFCGTFYGEIIIFLFRRR